MVYLVLIREPYRAFYVVPHATNESDAFKQAARTHVASSDGMVTGGAQFKGTTAKMDMEEYKIGFLLDMRDSNNLLMPQSLDS